MNEEFDPSLPDLHLEITSKCTLACPACPRTYRKGEYKVTDLPMSVIDNIVRAKQRYKHVTLCGDHGDPIYHSFFHQVVAKLQTLPGAPMISIATNGSYRPEEWWLKTAQLLREKDEIIFGVDGLEDTSHIYRRNNNWASILNGMDILKRHGQCKVRWQWILFQFNEHQMAGAAQVAHQMNIDKFMIVGSSRHEEVDPWKPSLSIKEAEEQFTKAYNQISSRGSYDLSPM